MKKGYIMIFVALWVLGIAITIGFTIFNVISIFNKNEEVKIGEKNEIVNNNVEIVTTSSSEEEKETIYIIKEYKGYIAVYVLDENGKEHLRESTQIVTKYLPDLDKKKLEFGIRVTGKEELNKVLEDYE